MAFVLPYPNDSFDRVVSNIVFHHLTRENKVRIAKEVLASSDLGGELRVADLGKSQNVLNIPGYAPP